jgi:hypothetical protein
VDGSGEGLKESEMGTASPLGLFVLPATIIGREGNEKEAKKKKRKKEKRRKKEEGKYKKRESHRPDAMLHATP